MGKTNSPLWILVGDDIEDLPEIKALAEAGHFIMDLGINTPPDLILGGRCWYMPPELIQYLPLALKAARKRKKDAQNPKKDSPRRVKVPKSRAS